MSFIPTLAEIEAASKQLAGRIVETPFMPLNSGRIKPHLPNAAHVVMKMELFQQAGSFKSRGVLLAIDAMDDVEKKAGITAVSAGNHALAVSWGAKQAGLSAKVVMPKTADNIRVNGCKALGAEVVLCDTVEIAFQEVERLVNEEGRTMVHPFESPFMTLGAATCGYELAKAQPQLDVLLVPIGGGGLIAGMASAFHHLVPECKIIGVEPYGADAMWQSLQKRETVQLKEVKTIADSLGAPMTLPQSFSIIQQLVDEVVRLEEHAFITAMNIMYDSMKIIAEPACASTLAATIGPMKTRLENKKVGIIACGSNISIAKFNRLIGA